jgi:hypothetical protein
MPAAAEFLTEQYLMIGNFLATDVTVSRGLFNALVDEYTPDQHYTYGIETTHSFKFRGIRILVGTNRNEWLVHNWYSQRGDVFAGARPAPPEQEVYDVVFD